MRSSKIVFLLFAVIIMAGVLAMSMLISTDITLDRTSDNVSDKSTFYPQVLDDWIASDKSTFYPQVLDDWIALGIMISVLSGILYLIWGLILEYRGRNNSPPMDHNKLKD